MNNGENEQPETTVAPLDPHADGALGLIAAELIRRVEDLPLLQRVPAHCTPDEQARLSIMLHDLTALRHSQAVLAGLPDMSVDVLLEAWPTLATLLSSEGQTAISGSAIAAGMTPAALPQPEGPPHQEAAPGSSVALEARPTSVTEITGNGHVAPVPAAGPTASAATLQSGTVPRSRAGTTRLLTTLAVGLAILVYSLDLTVVSTAAPTIIGEFHSLNLYGWLFSAYSIPVAATTLLYGRLGDVYGRKRLFSAAMIGFLLASIACGFAGSMAQLIAFRALQGICAGAIFPFSVAIIADVFPIEQRARGFSIVPSAFAFSSVLGPTAGGFITTGLGWRWIFFLNIPVVLVALGVLTLVYHETASMRRLTLRDIDITGAALVAGALVAALVAISIGGGPVAWLSWQESLLWTCVVALVVAFALWERRVRIPLLPLRILRHRGLGGALLTIALLIWIVDSLIFFIPSLAQGALGGTAQSAGIILIPLMLTWSLTALVSVRAGQRYGFRTMALGGCVALGASLIALTLVRADASQDALILPMLLAGLGAGLINPNMMLLAQNSLSDRDQGLAGGLGGCTLVLVAALVGPLLAALEVGRLTVHMGGRLPDTSQLLSAQGRHNLALQFGADYVHDLRLALGAALHDVFSAGFIALAVVTLVLLLIVPSNALARRIRLAPLSR